MRLRRCQRRQQILKIEGDFFMGFSYEKWCTTEMENLRTWPKTDMFFFPIHVLFFEDDGFFLFW